MYDLKVLEVRRLNWITACQNQGVGGTTFFLEALWGYLFACLLQLLGTACFFVPWPLPPSSKPTAEHLLISLGYWLCRLLFYFFFPFIFISWRLITLQYCSGFSIHWHESAMDLHVFPIPIPPPTSLSTPSLWVFPVHQLRTLVSCIQPGLSSHF